MPESTNLGEDRMNMAKVTPPAGPDIPETKPAPEKPKEQEIDGNGLPKELWPYRDDLLKWINDTGVKAKLLAFLQYRNENTRFELVGGKGFYHAPEERKISLDVREFKKMTETLGMTKAQFIFGAMHEFAHLKTMAELDSAGLHNQLEQFEYEKQKKYFARDPQGKPVALSARGAYRQFYNICEDAIVNSMVFDSGLFGESVTEISRKNHQEVVDLYTDRFFPIYLTTEPGQGEYALITDEKGGQEVQFVGSGQGDLRLANKEDFQNGFDWNAVVPPLNRVAQFITFFMKNQMIGLSSEQVSAQSEKKDGTHVLHDDVAKIFTESLSSSYRSLLEKVVAKYQTDPQMYSSILDLLSRVAYVNLYQDNGQEIVKVDGGTKAYYNVTMRGDGMPIDSNLTTLNIDLAVLFFERNIGKCLEQLGKKSSRELKSGVSYLDIFNAFKELDSSRSSAGTIPLKHNLVNRTHMMRTALEPIYTLLCILDESFQTKVEEKPPTPPGEPGDGDGEGAEAKESRKPITWEVGDKVEHKISGRKGIIKNITKDTSGNVESVEVEYYEPETSALADRVDSAKDILSGDVEIITKPIKEKIWVLPPDASEGGQSVSGKLDEDYDVKKDKDKKPSKGQGGQENQENDEDQDQNQDQDQTGQGQGGSQGEKEGAQNDIEEVMDAQEKALRDMIAADQRKRNTANAEAQRKTTEYQQKQAKKGRKKDLIAKTQDNEARNRGALSQGEGGGALHETEAMVQEYLKLEEQLRGPIEKMSQAWLEIINNISTKIDTVVDKYYLTGKADPKKLQKLLPQIELGMDIEYQMIYSRIIEKIKAELKPKMIRTILLIDDSGSMNGLLPQVRTSIMLLCASLRDLRGLFQQRLGYLSEGSEAIDLVCDTEIRSFASGAPHMIMPFQITEFDFLTDPEKSSQKPNLQGIADKQTAAVISAFRRLGGGGGTYDTPTWQDVVASHQQNPRLRELLKNGYMSEFILQISDGAISGTEETTALIDSIKQEYALATGGFAIGTGSGVDTAQAALEQRHSTVIQADSPDKIAAEFAEFLKTMIKEQIEKPMLEALDNI